MSSPAAKKRGLPSRVKMRHSSHFVEELTARGNETPLGRMAPLSSLMPDPKQPRTTMGDLSELVASVKDKGVLEPILARPIPDDADRGSSRAELMIISGERRYRAAMAAGLDEVPIIEMDVSEEEALEIALIENLQRKDLTPFEEAEGYKALADRFGYTHENISKAVGKSRTVVTESLALLAMPAKVRETALALGITTKSILLEVLKGESVEEMIHMLEQVSVKGLSRDDLRRQTRSDKTKSGAPRKRPFVFNYKPGDKSFSLSLKFRQTQVSKQELIDTLEVILQELREKPS